MHISFILVEPATPENIGAAARAIKTMGFGDLRLVNPCDHLADPARWLAHGSNDILEQASLFTSLSDAVKDVDFVIGTTAKQRSVKEDYLPARKLGQLLEGKKSFVRRAAVVFGREDSGLRNHELSCCDLVSSIPLASPFPSLNLAQAVMLYAYELSVARAGRQTINTGGNPQSLNQLKQNIEVILQDLGFSPDTNIYPRILERLMLAGETDLNLLHSVAARYRQKFL